MNEPFSDELISAFLDGELTADEQSLVEQTLMDSVEHRQVFEELRALRGSLQSLPSHKLPGDFSQRVLRRAELAMLRDTQPAVPAAASTGEQSSAEGKPAGDKSETTNLAVAPAASVKPFAAAPGQMRIAVLAFAALAAALLVAIYLPKIELTPVAVLGTGGSEPDVVEGMVNRQVIPPSPKMRVKEGPGRGEAALVPPPRDDHKVPDRQDLNRSIDAQLEKAMDDRADVISGEKGLEKSEEKGGRGDGGELPSNRRFAVGTKAEQSQSPRAELDLDSVTQAGPKPVAGLQADSLANGLSKGKELKELRDSIEPDLVVIPVNCTRQALESGEFDRVLIKHNVFFDDAVAASVPADASVKESAELKRNRQLSERASAAGFDMVEVEATRAQIDGILAEFQAHSDKFLGAAVQPLALEDSERTALLARAIRAKKSLENVEDELKLSARGKGAAGNLAATKELSPPAGPPTALDKVTGGARGGAASAGVGGGAPPAPAAPGAIRAAPAQAAGKSALAKDGAKSFEFRKIDDARQQDEAEQAKSVKKQTGSREETERVAGDKSVDSESGDAGYAGRASRLASPEFKKFYRLRGNVEPQDRYAAPAEERKAEFEGLERTDKLSEGREASAKQAEEALSETKRRPAAIKQDLDKNADLKSDAKESLGVPAGGSREKRATSAGQQRVRVLFVIKAVEEDVPAAKPE